MKRLLVTLTLSAVIAATAVAATAQGAPPPAPTMPAPGAMRPGGPGAQGMLVAAPSVSSAMRLIHPRMMPTLEERLKLTPEQKVKVDDLLNKSEADGAQLVLAQRKASEDFVTTLTKPNVTEAEITAAAKKAMDAEAAIITAKAKTMIQLRTLLTDEQNKAFTEMLDRYTQMWHARPGTHPAMGAPAAPQDAAK